MTFEKLIQVRLNDLLLAWLLMTPQSISSTKKIYSKKLFHYTLVRNFFKFEFEIYICANQMFSFSCLMSIKTIKTGRKSSLYKYRTTARGKIGHAYNYFTPVFEYTFCKFVKDHNICCINVGFSSCPLGLGTEHHFVNNVKSGRSYTCRTCKIDLNVYN